MAKAKELMSKNIVAVSPGTSAGSAMKLMKSMHVTVMPVISEGRLRGLVFEKDFGEFDGSEKVSSIMRRPVFVEEDSDQSEASKKMVENSVVRIPVVNNRKEMHCVGIISSTDIVKSVK